MLSTLTPKFLTVFICNLLIIFCHESPLSKFENKEIKTFLFSFLSLGLSSITPTRLSDFNGNSSRKTPNGTSTKTTSKTTATPTRKTTTGTPTPKTSIFKTAKTPTTMSTNTSATKPTSKTPTQPSSSKNLTKKNDSSKEIAPEKVQLAASRADGNHAFDDWVPIQMGFADLLPNLQPEFSEVDKVVNYILEQNIPVRYINVVYSGRSSVEDVDEIKKICPKYKHMRFVPGLSGDDGKILKRWKQLVIDAKIKNPEQCLEYLMASKRVFKFNTHFFKYRYLS